MDKELTEKPKEGLFRGKETILVVDDEELIMEIISQLLENIGYHVLEADTGEKAIQVARTFNGHIDLAILDVVLPDMGAIELYPLLMEARSDLKVIVCSGYSIDGPAREILDAGAQAFIQKPFSVTAISKKLKTILCS